MARRDERPLWDGVLEFMREPSYHGMTSCGQGAVLMSRLDDLQAVDVRGWMLEAALSRAIDWDAVLCVLELVERGAPMCEAAMACVRRAGHAFDKWGAHPLRVLVAAACWAGRGPELRQHLEAAVGLYPDACTAPPAPRLPWIFTSTGWPRPTDWPLPPTDTSEKACVDFVGAALLDILVNRAIGRRPRADARARINRLVQSGTSLGLVAVGWLEKFHQDGRGFVANGYMGFRTLLKAACQAGRDAELFKLVEQALVVHVMRDIRRMGQEIFDGSVQDPIGCARQTLKMLRDNGLLGPLAADLQAAFVVAWDEMNAWDDDAAWVEMDCIDACLELLTEYAEADRWYARHLAISLKQLVPYGPAQLIAAFAVAEPIQLLGRRREDGDPAAYTWEEFMDFYESVTEARWHWEHATPVIEQAGHEDAAPPIDPDAARTPPTDGSSADSADSVIELVLHAEPPARVEPESAAELVAVLEAGAVERQLGGAVLEETGIQIQVDRLFLLQFNRCSKAMRVALGEGLPLQRCRQELEAEGCSFLQPCGNMIFVHPNQYQHARQAPLPTTGVKHSCFYLIVAESLEYLVEESLSGIGKGAWARIREGLPLRSPSDAATIDGQDLPEESDPYESSGELVVKRTFLEYYDPNVRNSASVVQSTTEAHGGGANPRRRLPPADL